MNYDLIIDLVAPHDTRKKWRYTVKRGELRFKEELDNNG